MGRYYIWYARWASKLAGHISDNLTHSTTEYPCPRDPHSQQSSLWSYASPRLRIIPFCHVIISFLYTHTTKTTTLWIFLLQYSLLHFHFEFFSASRKQARLCSALVSHLKSMTTKLYTHSGFLSSRSALVLLLSDSSRLALLFFLLSFFTAFR